MELLRHIFDLAPVRQLIESYRRDKWWKNIPYENSLLFTVTITNKCTLYCDHCFEEAGPEKNDFLDSKRLDEIAQESTEIFKNYVSREIRITGGDPFLHPDLFQIIESFSRRKAQLEYGTLDVETNGWWATDNEKTEKTLLKLKEAGANLLSMTVDEWHCKDSPFDNEEHYDRLEKISENIGLEFRYIALPAPNIVDGELMSEVIPIGRGRYLPEKYWGDHLICSGNGCRLSPPIFFKVIGKYVHTDEITLGANGNVYPCNSGKEFKYITLSLGNIHENSLTEILDNQNPLVELIREKGLRALTKPAGLSLRQHWKMYDKFSPCGLCHEMLREYGEK